MKTIGIIGFGSFGKFLAEKLSPHVKILVYSYSGKENEWTASLDEVVQADYLIPAIPLSAYETTLENIRHKIGTQTIVIDVCSVKEEPLRIIRSILPNQPVVSTHPLFGPESVIDSLEGHVLVLCPEDSDEAASIKLEKVADSLGLEVIKMSAEEHDTEMAVVQGLTFFIAHSLKELHLHKQKLSTPSFQKLLQLANLEKHHSDELFLTIQAGNDKTKQIRRQFIDLAEKLDHEVNHRSEL
jgi:prephenate dehydrogenase